ncbi:hypothetical protein [uncultured Cohaesibacter sp.]|nr:hypothetical protein [uncultured Cohaesibacter sp.]
MQAATVMVLAGFIRKWEKERAMVEPEEKVAKASEKGETRYR